MNTLRRRFIAFNMLVISAIMLVMAVIVYWGAPQRIPLGRMTGIVCIALILAWAGSFLLSRVAIKPIQEAWKRQLDFTADASHELRTPLAVIQTNMELVLDSPEATVESQLKWLGNIHSETLRMGRLVEDLLTLSRSDIGVQTLQTAPLCLNDLVRDAVLSFEASAERQDISITVNMKEHIMTVADEQRLRQLMVILLDNAVRYMGGPGKIEISLRQQDQWAKLTVADTGIGMGRDHLERIFERFYRESGSRACNRDGFGLGLSIAKWIVTEHQGHIYADSNVGQGTKFTVDLPVNTAD